MDFNVGHSSSSECWEAIEDLKQDLFIYFKTLQDSIEALEEKLDKLIKQTTPSCKGCKCKGKG